MNINWHNDQHMKIETRNDVSYLVYPAWENQNWIRHGFSTRLGGVSEGIFASMNLSFTRGDDAEAVHENYRRIAGAIGFSPEDIVTSDQTHTTNVRVVTEKDRGCGITIPRTYSDVDGMITDVPGLVLATFFADCIPLYLIDPVQRVIGLSHSGWRGTAGKIGRVTVEAMKREYGCKPENLLAAIGPGICQECYEVSEDVIREFQSVFAREVWDELFYAKENGKYQLNLWKANEIIFLEAGIPSENISLPGICTCCNPEFLFSHRASGGRRGNLAAFLQIKE